MLQHYTLRTALLLFVLIPFVLLMGAGGLYSLGQLEKQVESRMQEDIELIARAIRLPLSHALDRGRIGSIEQALASAFRIDRVYGVYVYDEHGEQIASSGTRKARVASDKAAELASSGGRQGEYDEAGGEEIFSYFLPLTDRGGRINGLLQVTRRGTDFQHYITQVRIMALSALGVTSLILILVVIFGHYHAIGRYLRSMEQSMARIGAGESGHRIAEKGPAELHKLSQGINNMLDRITRSQREIEQQREREMQLRLRLERSEKLAAIGRLASGVAHELGTPLSTIDGKAQRLLRNDELETPVRESVNQMRTEVRHMEQIIHQMMDFGRRNPLQLRTADSGIIAHSVCQQLHADRTGADIRIELKGPHPGPAIAVDIMRIEQALGNLLRNAVQAARSTVSVDWYIESEWLVFSIEDDGPGIDENNMNNLFEPFYTTKPVGEGTGLGLAVVHAAVSDHNGYIEIDRSPVLSGARFRIYLRLDFGDQGVTENSDTDPLREN
ncbi:MAG: ATP-binding protein [Gammaproteobacteria bacterium]|nr:ATP-binding protein [Gammaproteobacteria bacterium]